MYQVQTGSLNQVSGTRISLGQPENNWELKHEERSSESWWYLGHAERCTFEFSTLPEEIPGVEWMVQHLAEALRSAVEREHGKVLHMKIYHDPAEWYRSKWLVEVVAHGSPLVWSVIIPLTLVLLGIAIIAWIVHEVGDAWWFGPATVAIGGGLLALGIGVTIREVRR